MGTNSISSYRDLKVWQRAMDLAVAVYHMTRQLPSEERFGLQSQARRAAVSVPANIAEGKGRRHLGEYLRSLSVARASLQELETHLELMKRLGLVPAGALEELEVESAEVGRMIAGLSRALRAKKP